MMVEGEEMNQGKVGSCWETAFGLETGYPASESKVKVRQGEQTRAGQSRLGPVTLAWLVGVGGAEV